MWDCPFVTLCELAQIEVGVGTLGSQQLLMRTLLDNVAMIHDQNQVGIHDRRQAMRDHKARTPAHERVHGAADGKLGTRIHARRRLVQDENRRVVEQHARDGQQLTLALADALGIVGHPRVITLRHGAHKEVDLRSTGGRNDFLARRLRAAIGDILGNRSVEQPGVLQHHAKLLT